jgi:hypothetical protein
MEEVKTFLGISADHLVNVHNKRSFKLVIDVA